jgi:predicted nucleic acid-binding protein
MTVRMRTDIQGYKFSETDDLLFDANIWLSVYGPLAGQDWRTKVYSNALSRIRRSGGRIHVDVLVLSEFINAFARIEYNQLPPSDKPERFKEFRDSEDFRPVAEEIAIGAREIVSKCARCSSRFDRVDIIALLEEYESNSRDFNDLMLAEICRIGELILVTHDGDFAPHDIPILTANKRLLSQ